MNPVLLFFLVIAALPAIVLIIRTVAHQTDNKVNMPVWILFTVGLMGIIMVIINRNY